MKPNSFLELHPCELLNSPFGLQIPGERVDVYRVLRAVRRRAECNRAFLLFLLDETDGRT